MCGVFLWLLLQHFYIIATSHLITYAVADDRKEEQRSEEAIKAERKQNQLLKITQPGVDTEAAWLKKAGKLHYGYKKHLCTDDAEGMIMAVTTTAAMKVTCIISQMWWINQN